MDRSRILFCLSSWIADLGEEFVQILPDPGLMYNLWSKIKHIIIQTIKGILIANVPDAILCEQPVQLSEEFRAGSRAC